MSGNQTSPQFYSINREKREGINANHSSVSVMLTIPSGGISKLT